MPSKRRNRPGRHGPRAADFASHIPPSTDPRVHAAQQAGSAPATTVQDWQVWDSAPQQSVSPHSVAPLVSPPLTSSVGSPGTVLRSPATQTATAAVPDASPARSVRRASHQQSVVTEPADAETAAVVAKLFGSTDADVNRPEAVVPFSTVVRILGTRLCVSGLVKGMLRSAMQRQSLESDGGASPALTSPRRRREALDRGLFEPAPRMLETLAKQYRISTRAPLTLLDPASALRELAFEIELHKAPRFTADVLDICGWIVADPEQAMRDRQIRVPLHIIGRVVKRFDFLYVAREFLMNQREAAQRDRIAESEDRVAGHLAEYHHRHIRRGLAACTLQRAWRCFDARRERHKRRVERRRGARELSVIVTPSGAVARPPTLVTTEHPSAARTAAQGRGAGTQSTAAPTRTERPRRLSDADILNAANVREMAILRGELQETKGMAEFYRGQSDELRKLLDDLRYRARHWLAFTKARLGDIKMDLGTKRASIGVRISRTVTESEAMLRREFEPDKLKRFFSQVMHISGYQFGKLFDDIMTARTLVTGHENERRGQLHSRGYLLSKAWTAELERRKRKLLTGCFTARSDIAQDQTTKWCNSLLRLHAGFAVARVGAEEQQGRKVVHTAERELRAAWVLTRRAATAAVAARMEAAEAAEEAAEAWRCAREERHQNANVRERAERAAIETDLFQEVSASLEERLRGEAGTSAKAAEVAAEEAAAQRRRAENEEREGAAEGERGMRLDVELLEMEERSAIGTSRLKRELDDTKRAEAAARQEVGRLQHANWRLGEDHKVQVNEMTSLIERARTELEESEERLATRTLSAHSAAAEALIQFEGALRIGDAYDETAQRASIAALFRRRSAGIRLSSFLADRTTDARRRGAYRKWKQRCRDRRRSGRTADALDRMHSASTRRRAFARLRSHSTEAAARRTAEDLRDAKKQLSTLSREKASAVQGLQQELQQLRDAADVPRETLHTQTELGQHDRSVQMPSERDPLEDWAVEESRAFSAGRPWTPATPQGSAPGDPEAVAAAPEERLAAESDRRSARKGSAGRSDSAERIRPRPPTADASKQASAAAQRLSKQPRRGSAGSARKPSTAAARASEDSDATSRRRSAAKPAAKRSAKQAAGKPQRKGSVKAGRAEKAQEEEAEPREHSADSSSDSRRVRKASVKPAAKAQGKGREGRTEAREQRPGDAKSSRRKPSGVPAEKATVSRSASTDAKKPGSGQRRKTEAEAGDRKATAEASARRRSERRSESESRRPSSIRKEETSPESAVERPDRTAPKAAARRKSTKQAPSASPIRRGSAKRAARASAGTEPSASPAPRPKRAAKAEPSADSEPDASSTARGRPVKREAAADTAASTSARRRSARRAEAATDTDSGVSPVRRRRSAKPAAADSAASARRQSAKQVTVADTDSSASPDRRRSAKRAAGKSAARRRSAKGEAQGDTDSGASPARRRSARRAEVVADTHSSASPTRRRSAKRAEAAGSASSARRQSTDSSASPARRRSARRAEAVANTDSRASPARRRSAKRAAVDTDASPARRRSARRAEAVADSSASPGRRLSAKRAVKPAADDSEASARGRSAKRAAAADSEGTSPSPTPSAARRRAAKPAPKKSADSESVSSPSPSRSARRREPADRPARRPSPKPRKAAADKAEAGALTAGRRRPARQEVATDSTSSASDSQSSPAPRPRGRKQRSAIDVSPPRNSPPAPLPQRRARPAPDRLHRSPATSPSPTPSPVPSPSSDRRVTGRPAIDARSRRSHSATERPAGATDAERFRSEAQRNLARALELEDNVRSLEDMLRLGGRGYQEAVDTARRMESQLQSARCAARAAEERAAKLKARLRRYWQRSAELRAQGYSAEEMQDREDHWRDIDVPPEQKKDTLPPPMHDFRQPERWMAAMCRAALQGCYPEEKPPGPIRFGQQASDYRAHVEAIRQPPGNQHSEAPTRRPQSANRSTSPLQPLPPAAAAPIVLRPISRPGALRIAAGAPPPDVGKGWKGAGTRHHPPSLYSNLTTLEDTRRHQAAVQDVLADAAAGATPNLLLATPTRPRGRRPFTAAPRRATRGAHGVFCPALPGRGRQRDNENNRTFVNNQSMPPAGLPLANGAGAARTAPSVMAGILEAAGA
eukprot:TRINITY_DN1556_c0_g1_i1.p1 TRINITY_DN1556_c0_g1~~TRINITY_DN1556_c0_g1_i1.p1  ORF type:complete len:2133 (+),score=438.75 TRINITY_DN1556_c0_g1_i1:70-6468(+)